MIHLRIFLPVFFLLYFLLIFLMYPNPKKEKSRKLKRMTVLNDLIWMLVITLVTFFSLFPDVYHEYIFPIEVLKSHVLSWTAIGIMSIAFFLVFLAKNEHRLYKNQTRNGWLLLDSGVYAKSRNPLYIGQIITLVGLFLCIPSIYSALLLLIGSMIVFIRVGLEEKVLESVFGDDYLEYENRVDRWL